MLETSVDLMHIIVDCAACTGDVGDISFTTKKPQTEKKKKSIHRNSDFLNLVVMVAVVICCIRIQLNGYQFIYSNSIPFLWLAAKFQTQFAYSTCKSNIPLADLPNKISVLIGNSLCKYSVKLLFNFLFGLFGT